MDFQNTAFRLAERKTEAVIARVFVDWCVERLVAKDLDTVTASMAKYWCSEKQVQTADECLQLFGGYATCGNIRSRECSSIPGSRRSTAAPTRS